MRVCRGCLTFKKRPEQKDCDTGLFRVGVELVSMSVHCK